VVVVAAGLSGRYITDAMCEWELTKGGMDMEPERTGGRWMGELAWSWPRVDFLEKAQIPFSMCIPSGHWHLKMGMRLK